MKLKNLLEQVDEDVQKQQRSELEQLIQSAMKAKPAKKLDRDTAIRYACFYEKDSIEKCFKLLFGGFDRDVVRNNQTEYISRIVAYERLCETIPISKNTALYFCDTNWEIELGGNIPKNQISVVYSELVNYVGAHGKFLDEIKVDSGDRILRTEMMYIVEFLDYIMLFAVRARPSFKDDIIVLFK
jgi:hypothetical protein